VRAPLAFWRCAHDGKIPVEASRHLAAAIAGAQRHLCPGEGHFVVNDRWPEIVGWLVG
jgi:pimeloyl-ACP methyl ester carboxylesterase